VRQIGIDAKGVNGGAEVSHLADKNVPPHICIAGIYVMNSDGSAVRRLTNTRGFDRMPSWSPDGKKIALISSRDHIAEKSQSDIYVMNADG